MSTNGQRRILIAGGGIGGLTLALALLRRGFDVALYEQAPELKEVGAGLQISTNGMLVLAALGIGDRVMALAARPLRRNVRLWNTGQTWTSDLGPSTVARYGHPHVTMYRPDLLGVLADAVREVAPAAINLGRQVVACEQDDARVTLRFADGGRATGDVLIGADGIHSVVRDALHGIQETTFTGLAVWRGVIPAECLPESMAASTIVAGWMGPGGHVVQYPLRRGELINFGGVVERREWHSESWMTPGSQAEMRAAFAGWHGDIQTLVDQIEHPLLQALKLRRPLPQWSCGRMTLLGDACHPTLPFLAQGAVMAMEDGLVLARALVAYAPDVAAALRAYEAARKARTTRIIEGSAANTHRFHNAVLADPTRAQAYVEREIVGPRDRDAFDWIYGYDASTVAV